MRGLLLKDFYMLKTHFRAFLILDLVMIFAPCFMPGTDFMLLYPCLLTGMIPMTLISYEEKEKWNVYACTLPYDRRQIVTGKYVLSAIFGTALPLLTVLVQAILALSRGTLSPLALCALAGTLFSVCVIPTALLLPFLYRFGTEKGRLLYLLTIAITSAGLGAVGGFSEDNSVLLTSGNIGIVLFFASVLLLTASWGISVAVYRKREI